MSETGSSVPPELLGLVDRPIAVYPVYARIAGTIDGGVVLSQMIYWQQTAAARERGGWWAHETLCLAAQCGVTRDAVLRTRRRLRDAGALHERRTLQGRVASRLDFGRLAELVREHSGGGSGTTDCQCDRSLSVRAAEIAARSPEVGIQTSRSSVSDSLEMRDTDVIRSGDRPDTVPETSSSIRAGAPDDDPHGQDDDHPAAGGETDTPAIDLPPDLIDRVAARLPDVPPNKHRGYCRGALSSARLLSGDRATDDRHIDALLAAARLRGAQQQEQSDHQRQHSDLHSARHDAIAEAEQLRLMADAADRAGGPGADDLRQQAAEAEQRARDLWAQITSFDFAGGAAAGPKQEANQEAHHD